MSNAIGAKSGTLPADLMARFADLLRTEYGFSDDDMTRILEAADRAMLSAG